MSAGLFKFGYKLQVLFWVGVCTIVAGRPKQMNHIVMKAKKWCLGKMSYDIYVTTFLILLKQN